MPPAIKAHFQPALWGVSSLPYGERVLHLFVKGENCGGWGTARWARWGTAQFSEYVFQRLYLTG